MIYLFNFFVYDVTNGLNKKYTPFIYGTSQDLHKIFHFDHLCKSIYYCIIWYN